MVPLLRSAALRRSTHLLLTSFLAAALASCGSDPRQRQAELARQQQLARQRQELAQCRRSQARLPAELAQFRQRAQALAVIDAEQYWPSPAPKPLDPDEQRRLAIYDQEVEQEQYDQAVAAWEVAEAERSARWRRRQASRRAEAAAALASSAEQLRAVSPRLLSSGPSPRLQEPVVRQFLACRPESFQ